MMRVPAAVALQLLLVPACGVGAAARGGIHGENPWAAEHIEGLPLDLRRDVDVHARACGNAPAARHFFSTSISVGGQVFRSLHFEEFRCDGYAAVCNTNGCLHEIYLESNGRYRRVFGIYAHDVTMLSERGALAVEVSGGRSGGIYRWNGSRFVPAGEVGR